MLISVLKSKLHRACVTDANVDYEGSLTLPRKLMELVGMVPYERILVGNLNNGERFETYIIVNEKSETDICLNGATAHLGRVGDRLTIMSFALLDQKEAAGHKPKWVNLDRSNKPD